VSLRPTYRCLVIGEGMLPLQCGQALLSRGHVIVALVAPSTDAHEWAAEHAVRRLDGDIDLTKALAGESIDLLFSIVNPRILSADTCKLATRAAINYHDALLPRYAGVHATTWAIMAGDEQHGVTWHEITQTVDAGRIYVQRTVPISCDETALTLNVKCYEAAAVSFGELLDGLEQDAITPRLQALEGRSYFSRLHRPPMSATINWDQPAAMVSAFVRALDFGMRLNPIARPKLWVGGVPFACRSALPLNVATSDTPGTVVAIDAAGLVIAANDGLVRVADLATLHGELVDHTALNAQPGDVVTAPPDAIRRHNDERTANAARYERSWVRRLSELRAPILPVGDAPRGPRTSGTRGRVPVGLPASLSAPRPSNDEAVLIALLAVYLTRIGDGAPFDIALMHGTSAADDPLFLSWFPLRCDLDLGAPFPDCVRAIERQVRELRTQASIASDVFARYPTLQSQPIASAGTRVRLMRVGVLISDTAFAQVPAEEMELQLVMASDFGSATLDFDTSLVPHDVALRMSQHLQALLKDAALHPSRALGELDIMSVAERQLVLHTWNDTRVPYPRDSTIAEVFSGIANRQADAVAIVEKGGELTYRALDQRANQLAHRLRRLGATSDHIIGLGVDRSADAVVAMLGILKAGGAYLPLDTANPSARLSHMLTDCNVRIVVSTRQSVTAIPIDASHTVVLLDDSSLSDESICAPPSDTTAESLAYVMYTSGSTGRPKGVAVTQRGVIRLVCNATHSHSGTDDVRLGYAPLAFDASTFEIWGALLTGGCLALFPNELATTDELGAFVAHYEVTTVFLTSALFSGVVDRGLSGFDGVRQLLTGGEVISPAHVRRALRALPNCRLINAYGPTENTTFTTSYTVPPTWLDEPDTSPVPIGRPITNTTAYVLDQRYQPLPIGVVGELHAGGDGLARGYVNDATGTATRFVANPFGGAPEARLYATGDLARWRSDGLLEYVGRRDTQVKIRGFRIELGEIEAVLGLHEHVGQVAVVVQHNRAGDPRLVAFYTIHALSPIAPPPPVLRAHVAASLPSYMVPARYVALNALPLTPTGKVDRGALPHSTDNGTAHSEPASTSPVVLALISMWQDVLDLPHVGIHDDFFMLGGHSLLAIQLLSRIADQFGVRLPLRAVFETPTIADIATHIGNGLAAQREPSGNGVASDDITSGPHPLSLGQEVLWLLQSAMPTLNAYNVAEHWVVEGPMDVNSLECALTALVDRHAALRTTFADYGRGPVQTIQAAMPVTVEFIEASGLSADERTAAVQSAVLRPFNLSEDLLLRVTLLRESELAYRLAIVTHHIVDDGWSRAILRRELSELYDACVAGPLPSPAPPTLPYALFATRQRMALHDGQRAQHDAYWRARLSGWQATSYVRADRPRSTVMQFEGAAVTASMSPQATANVHELARANGATPFMVLFAAFQLLLHRHSGDPDIVVGTVSASREQREWENVVGYFASPIAIRTSFEGDPTFEELIARVRAEQIRAMEHAAVPIELVMSEPLPGDVARPLPLFRTMCVLQNNEQVAFRLGAANARDIQIAAKSSKFDLSLLLSECDGALNATFEYRQSLFDAATITRLLEQYQVLLQAAAHGAKTPASRIPLLSSDAREQMLIGWNSSGAALDDRCLHDLVKEQAQRTPRAVAVTGMDGTLTYQQLMHRARLLANDLEARGVGPNVLVGVCVERSVQLVVALLAVLEAGGAYVPLDPDYPSDRLRFMLADANIAIVITAGTSRDALPAHGSIVVHLDDADWTKVVPEMTDPPSVPVTVTRRPTADDLAYVIYTSGSTGQPKGAMNTHRAACNFVRRSAELHDLAESDTVLQKTPVSFDPSVWEIFGALTVGARLVLARPRGHADPAYLATAIAEHRITAMNIVPSMLQALLDVPSIASQAAALRIITCGGEVMSPALQKRCLSTLPAVRLHNAYGPTETAVNVCDWACERDDTRPFVPIGRPLPNVHVYCLDDAGEPVPPGVVGELYIGGAAVGTGYHGKPELTSERFVMWPHPSRPHETERLYRTGDMVCVDQNGIIEYLGRRDHQIKIRGVRIELGEVESALVRHPALRAAAVIVRDDAHSGRRRLVGYVVPRAAASVTARVLREHLRGLLLDAMIPSTFVVLNELPIMPNGKVDREALPAPSYERTDDAVFVAPCSPTEITLAMLITDVVGIDHVGVHDNFFELGGHSLAAMEMVSRALRLGIPLTVRDVFDHPTVAALAVAVDSDQSLQTPTKPASNRISRVARGAYRRANNSAGDQ
jgi:amino acid adenylation domain-containing protein